MRRWRMVCILFLALLVPSFAFAADGSGGGSFDYEGVVYGPTSVGADGNLVQVNAGNEFQAALFVLGYDYESSEFTADVKAYLSNADTGTFFYDFAYQFTNNNDRYGESGLDMRYINFNSSLSVNNQIYGKNLVWCAEYTDDDYNDAKRRVEEILAGDVGGGGSGGGDISDVTSVVSLYPYGHTYNLNSWSVPHDVYGTPTFNLTDSAKSQFISIMQTYGLQYYVFVVQERSNNRNNGGGQDKYLIASSSPVTVDINYVGTSPTVIDLTFTSDTVLYRSVLGGSAISHNRNTGEISGNVNIEVNGISSLNTTTYTLYGETTSGTKYYTPWVALSLDLDSTVIPPTNWPDDTGQPSTEKPEVPDAPTPAERPTYPTQEVYNNVTYVTADISAILDALNEHCKHLQDAIYNASKDLYESLSMAIDGIMETWTDYFHDMMEWLAKQFDYSVSAGEYDDSSVVSWLKKIWGKLGTGTSTKPNDPVVKPDDTGSWLDVLFNNLFTALNDIFGGLRDALGGLVNGLKGKFPFSIPWDIAAMLGLLAATPQVPIFDMPAYTVTSAGGLQQVGTYHIDLTDWDTYINGVRFMIKFVWIGYLLAHTKEYMELLEKVVGFDA